MTRTTGKCRHQRCLLLTAEEDNRGYWECPTCKRTWDNEFPLIVVYDGEVD